VNSTPWYVYLIGAVVAILMVVSFGTYISSTAHTETMTGCVVNDKDRVRGSDGKSDMRVYTDNCGVLTVKDSLIAGNFSASDRFNSIKVGQTYDFDTRGKRVGFFSMFPNIVTIRSN
jgi:hypothetical protein